MRTFINQAVAEFRELRELNEYGTNWRFNPFGSAIDIDEWFTQKLQQLAKQKDEEFMKMLEDIRDKYIHSSVCPINLALNELRNKLRGGKDGK